METKDRKDPVIPEGFEHIEERLQETTSRVEQIDSQIKNIPKEKGPAFKYDPPYDVGRIIPGTRDKERIALQDKQHELKMDTLSQTEAATRNVDGKTGRIVRDVVREKLFPNPYRTLSEEERKAQKSERKVMEQSQDYMDAMLSPKEEKPKDAIPPEQVTSEGKNIGKLSMSARFMMTLHPAASEDGSVKIADKVRQRDKDIDRD